MITKVYYSVAESDSETFGLPNFFYEKDCADFNQSLEPNFDDDYKDSNFIEIECEGPALIKGALTKKEYINNLKKIISYGYNLKLKRIEDFIASYEASIREEKIDNIIKD
jgi:hypothetical protein